MRVQGRELVALDQMPVVYSARDIADVRHALSRELREGPPARGPAPGPVPRLSRILLTYRLFGEINTKSQLQTVGELYLKQLVQVKSLGPDMALAIAQEYPTLFECVILLGAHRRPCMALPRVEALTEPICVMVFVWMWMGRM